MGVFEAMGFSCFGAFDSCKGKSGEHTEGMGTNSVLKKEFLFLSSFIHVKKVAQYSF